MSEDDDGLLLNFSTEPVKVQPKPSKNSETKQRHEGKSNTRATAASRTKVPISAQSKSKTKPVSKTSKDSAKSSSKRRNEDKGSYSAKRAKNDKLDKNTFVSSLFSLNGSTLNVDTSSHLELDPSNAPDSDANFESLGIDKRLSTYLEEKLRLKTPTKIQKQVIPVLLKAQQDLFIQAQTGSGKTLSFALPIFHTLMNLLTPVTRESGLFAIMLAPTRELASQIYAVLEQLNKRYVKIVPGIVIGGEKKKSEKARLRKGVNILVSTPGRLLDHLKSTKNLNENLNLVRWLILDEGDKLMELGFEETLSEIVKILENFTSKDPSHKSKRYPELPTRRVNVLCSATIKKNVEKLGQLTLQSPKLITSGSDDSSELSVAPSQLTQQILVVPPKLRLVTLAGILKLIAKTEGGLRTIVFLSCSDSVEFHFDTFTRQGKLILSLKGGHRLFTKSQKSERTTSDGSDMVDLVMTGPTIGENVAIHKLHGVLPQHIRTSTLNHFAGAKNATQHSILLCTDVASRGLDLPAVSTVIEYDPAFSVDDHLHRIGRTARAGQKGKSMLFLLPGDEEKYIDLLKPHHPSGFDKVPYEKVLKPVFEIKEKEKKWDIEATTWHLSVERWLLEDQGELAKAERAFTLHLRAYATHLAVERECFNIKTLHLGHLAKSFGLRETPKNLGRKFGGGKTNGKLTDSKKQIEDPKKKMLKMAALAVKQLLSEFNFV